MTATVRYGWPELRLFILVAAAYGAGAEMSWHSWKVAESGFAAGAHGSWQWFGAAVGFAFFPPAGVTVSAMLLTRRAQWPVIVAAIVAAEMLVDARHAVSVLTAVGFALANMVEPLIGASAVRAWCGGPPDLRLRRDLALFVAGACLLGPLTGGLLGAAIGVAHGGIWWPAAVLRWLAGDGLGALVVGLPIVLWPRQRQILRARPIETVLVLAVVAALSVAAFWVRTPPALLLLPALAWAGFRLEVIGAALAAAVLALVANYLTAAGHGAVAALPLRVPFRLALMQLYVAVLVLVTVLVGQESAGRIAAVKRHQLEQRERVRLQTLARLAELLAAAGTPQEIGEVVAAQVLHDAGAQALMLGLLSADGRTLDWVHIAGFPAAAAVSADDQRQAQAAPATDAVRTGNPILVRTRAECQRRYPQTASWMTATGAVSLADWPLVAGGRPVGVLGLMWTQPQPLDAAQQAYASAVAAMIAQALPRARRYADERDRASALQSAVLPSHPAEIAGLEIAVCYEPADAAHGLGGDWYDAVALPENRVFLAVGDVVGHGLPAVEDMAQLRAAGRALAVQGLPPSQLLAQLDIVARRASQGKYATMTVAVFDPASASLSYGSAGHPPALLRRCRADTISWLDGGRGIVLGAARQAVYTQSDVPIDRGDILIMYTDGLIERRGEDIETRMALAQQYIAGWDADTPLTEACDRLIATLAPPPRSDDVCVLAVRFG